MTGASATWKATPGSVGGILRDAGEHEPETGFPAHQIAVIAGLLLRLQTQDLELARRVLGHLDPAARIRDGSIEVGECANLPGVESLAPFRRVDQSLVKRPAGPVGAALRLKVEHGTSRPQRSAPAGRP